MSETYNDNGQDIIFDEFTSITYDIIEDSKKLVVKLGKPQKDPVWKYYCPYQIIAPDETIKHRAPGVDELKSIQNAMRMINIELKSVIRQKSYKVQRLGHIKNDLGFFEWDIFELKDKEASFKYDVTLSSEERSKLEKEAEVINERIEERLKQRFTPEKQEKRDLRKVFEKNPEFIDEFKKLKESNPTLDPKEFLKDKGIDV